MRGSARRAGGGAPADLGDQLGPELVALAGDVAQAQDLDAEYRWDRSSGATGAPRTAVTTAASGAAARQRGGNLGASTSSPAAGVAEEELMDAVLGGPGA